MAQFCFNNWFVEGRPISCSRQRMKKRTLTHFRICLGKALSAVLVFHLKQCGVVWYRALRVKQARKQPTNQIVIGRPGTEPHFPAVDFPSLNQTDSNEHPARRLALQGQCSDWLARCQYTVTGRGSKFDLQLLSQCGSTTWTTVCAYQPLEYTCMLLES